MLYREIIAVCSQIHTKHINTPCRHNLCFVHVKSGGKQCHHGLLNVQVDNSLSTPNKHFLVIFPL